MTAEIVGYDYPSKSVTFRKGDGAVYQYPLIQLDVQSKLKAVSSPEVFATSGQWEPSFAQLLWVVLICLILPILIWIPLDVGSIWTSAALVAHAPEFARSMKLWLKMLILQITFTILLGFIRGIFGALGGDIQQSIQQVVAVGWVLGGFRIIVTFLIIQGHFDIGFFRSFVFLIAYVFFFGLAAC